jgi:hypothetical protein
MDLLIGLMIVAVIALLGAMAVAFGVDSRTQNRRVETNEWI